jgi:hypothetical protein
MTMDLRYYCRNCATYLTFDAAALNTAVRCPTCFSKIWLKPENLVYGTPPAMPRRPDLNDRNVGKPVSTAPLSSSTKAFLTIGSVVLFLVISATYLDSLVQARTPAPPPVQTPKQTNPEFIWAKGIIATFCAQMQEDYKSNVTLEKILEKGDEADAIKFANSVCEFAQNGTLEAFMAKVARIYGTSEKR